MEQQQIHNIDKQKIKRNTTIKSYENNNILSLI